jgi:hypothetical protein
MALALPQENNSRIRIPNVPNYRWLLEAYGFWPAHCAGASILMERRFPDNNGYDGAWQARAAVPAGFEAEVQRQIQIVH